jgi:membrane associated rhomboid family serine protease
MLPFKDNIPTGRFPYVTVGLILVNLIAYLVAVIHGGSVIGGPDTHELLRYGATPHALTHPSEHTAPDALPAWETVFTSMFIHASVVQLAVNMLFLWIYGNNVEGSLGHAKYLVFYLLSGIAALALVVALQPNSTAPIVGSGGAVAGVLGAHAVLYTRARVVTLVFLPLFLTAIETPSAVMIGVWFAVQAVFGIVNLTDPTGGGGVVACFASVGGFIFGAVAIRAVRAAPVTPR